MAADTTALLGEPANSFKGGRRYVHGTDILAALEGANRPAEADAHVSRIEFVQPLEARGCVHFGADAGQAVKTRACAVGEMDDGQGARTPFVVFTSPLPVTGAEREFDEASLLGACRTTGGGGVSLAAAGDCSFYEQVSSAMKALCRHHAPGHERWWFARFIKEAPAPKAHTRLELSVERIVAGRLVSALVKVDGVRLGRIDFVGAPS